MEVAYAVGLIDRLRRKYVKTESGCWLWLAAHNIGGYGVIGVKGQMRVAHRVNYEAFHGPIPNGLQMDHLCRVRDCVNPDHLEIVTQQENIRRGQAGSNMRARTHCPQGHPYSGENLYVRPGGKRPGSRECRACRAEYVRSNRDKMNEHNRRYRERLRA